MSLTSNDEQSASPEFDWVDVTDESEIRGPWEVVPGMQVLLPLKMRANAENGLTWRMTVDRIGTRLACVGLTVEQTDEAAPHITSALLRTFAIQRHVHAIVLAALTSNDPSDPFKAPLDEPADLRTAGPTDENLRYVASVYRLAEITNNNPTKALEALGLTRRTAQHWMKSAREKELI